LRELVFDAWLKIGEIEVALIVEAPAYSTSDVVAKSVGKVPIVADSDEELIFFGKYPIGIGPRVLVSFSFTAVVGGRIVLGQTRPG
jgi:hypothetical protein